MKQQAETILSIQSHVAYGYVGNRAAMFPLQRFGFEVIAIHTVQFSNHTGYGSWTGEVFDPAHIEDILAGLETRGTLNKVDAILTGYLGDSRIGDIVLDTVSRLEKTLWACDPVMGDTDRGFFVKEGIPEFFKNIALKKASIITPNQFELEYLTDIEIKNLDDVFEACEKIHQQGPEIVLVTSLEHEKLPQENIQMLASQKKGERYIVTTPKLSLSPPPNGAGDCTAALFLGHLLKGENLDEALSKTASSIFAIFERTQKDQSRELALIKSQDQLINPSNIFDVTKA